MKAIESSDSIAASKSSLSGVLSKILCINNRKLNRKQISPEASILIVEAGEASAGKADAYIPFMNTVFEAQRQRIKIDVLSFVSSGSAESEPSCDLPPPNTSSVLLKQAAAISGGYFYTLTSLAAFHSVLFDLPLGSVRSLTGILNFPKQSSVDFRGNCYCHGRVVEVGFVCSVCLSGKPTGGVKGILINPRVISVL